MKMTLVGLCLFIASTTATAQRVEGYGGVSGRGTGHIVGFSVSEKKILFPEVGIGFFHHDNGSATFVSLRGGVRTATKGFFGEGIFGITFLTMPTTTLGTNLEFHTTLSVGWTFRRVTLKTGFTHFSNARRVFGFRGPNLGENFYVAGIGYDF